MSVCVCVYYIQIKIGQAKIASVLENSPKWKRRWRNERRKDEMTNKTVRVSGCTKRGNGMQ